MYLSQKETHLSLAVWLVHCVAVCYEGRRSSGNEDKGQRSDPLYAALATVDDVYDRLIIIGAAG